METGWIVGGVMTSLAFAMNIRDPIALAWVMSTGRYVYGADRYFDGKTIHDDSITSILLALAISVSILYANNMIIWAIPEVVCSAGYPLIKQKFPIYKPFHVGLCWTFAIAVVPQLISNSPIDTEAAISLFFISSAMSNYEDIKDIDEDKVNNVNTIPVVYGRRKALAVSTVLFSLGVVRSARPKAFPLFTLRTPRLIPIPKNKVPKNKVPKNKVPKNKIPKNKVPISTWSMVM